MSDPNVLIVHQSAIFPIEMIEPIRLHGFIIESPDLDLVEWLPATIGPREFRYTNGYRMLWPDFEGNIRDIRKLEKPPCEHIAVWVGYKSMPMWMCEICHIGMKPTGFIPVVEETK